VLGTSFYVKAYDSLAAIFVGVEEGMVKVIASGTNVILEAGESISIDKSTKQFQSLTFNPNDLFWKSQTLIFRNERLEKVFATLEKKYNISINIVNKQILECRLSAKFYGEDIAQIFDIINMNFNLTIQEQDNQYTISGGGCN
jgi:transmembrane sensor